MAHLALNQTLPTMTVSLLFDSYRGDIPYTTQVEARSWFQHILRLKLRMASLKAFRFAVKLAFDQSIEGEPSTFEELKGILDTYSTEWSITMDPKQSSSSDPSSGPLAWGNTLAEGIPNLFALSRKKETGVISVRILSKQKVVMKIASLNAEAVKGIWANLVYEILYLTNDDDERYSIQAHEVPLYSSSYYYVI